MKMIVEEIKKAKKTEYQYEDVFNASLDYFKGDDLAATTWINKYAIKNNGKYFELTPKDMHKRLAKEFARIEEKYESQRKVNKGKLSQYGQNREQLNEEKIFNYFDHFKYIVPQGSVMSVLGNQFVVGSLSNCIVLPKIYDSYGGIMFADQQLTSLYKRRTGVGLDISTLRPEGESVSNAAGSTTGAVSFMDRFSNTTREVAQNGRRGALMITIDIRHPDVEKFIGIKQDLTKITGANISVKLTDEFMNAVVNDEDFHLRFPISEDDAEFLSWDKPLIDKWVKAKDLWNLIIQCAWSSAEPGLIFWDRQHTHSTSSVYPEYKNISTNPCCFYVGQNVYVMTKGGIKEIKNITNGDLIWLDGDQKWSKNSGYFNAGFAPVYEVSFENGEKFTITENHKLGKVNDSRGETGFKLIELKNLKINDKIKLHVNPVNVSIESKKLAAVSFYGDNEKDENINSDYNDGLILGWLTGDGALSYRNNKSAEPTMYLSFWRDEHDIVPIYEKIINDYIGVKASSTVNRVNNNDVIRIHSEVLTRYFQEKYGFNIWKFKNGYNEFLFESSTDFLRGYLASYFTADGSVQYRKGNKSTRMITLGSIDFDRLNQIKYILNIFGIKSQVKLLRNSGEATFRGKTYATKNCYRLIITGHDSLIRFNNQIGFLSKNKSNILTTIINEISGNRSQVKEYTRIIDIKFIGMKEVGCISVEDGHYFTANGLISGNSEIAMGNDSCRLISNNMFSCVVNPFTKDAHFDFDKWYEVNYESQRLMDDLVDLELESIEKILKKIEADPEPTYVKEIEIRTWKQLYETGKNGRRTGLGFTALADTIAALNLDFSSNDALKVIDSIMKKKCEAEFDSSIDMAVERGEFKGFNPEIEETSEFVQMLKQDLPHIYNRMMQYGRRNVSISTIAPNGTVSLMTQTSSGIEPVFMLSYKRRRKVNPNDVHAKVDFKDDLGDSWQEFIVYHDKLKMWMNVTGETDIEKSPYHGSTAGEIDWVERVKLQGICQKYITHSISSTINLPKDISTDKVGEIYLESWRHGLKGITVYRDGSRTGVLVAADEPQQSKVNIKRPAELNCDIHHVTAVNKKWIVLVGINEGKPFEVFAFTPKNVHLSPKWKNGKLVRTGRGKYDLVIDDDFIVEDIGNCFESDEHGALTRMISTSLQFGVSIERIVDQLDKSEGTVVSFNKSISRTLKKYSSSEDRDHKCGECGDPNGLVFEEGCIKCVNCGNSKCT